MAPKKKAVRTVRKTPPSTSRSRTRSQSQTSPPPPAPDTPAPSAAAAAAETPIVLEAPSSPDPGAAPSVPALAAAADEVPAPEPPAADASPEVKFAASNTGVPEATEASAPDVGLENDPSAMEPSEAPNTGVPEAAEASAPNTSLENGSSTMDPAKTVAKPAVKRVVRKVVRKKIIRKLVPKVSAPAKIVGEVAKSGCDSPSLLATAQVLVEKPKPTSKFEVNAEEARASKEEGRVAATEEYKGSEAQACMEDDKDVVIEVDKDNVAQASKEQGKDAVMQEGKGNEAQASKEDGKDAMAEEEKGDEVDAEVAVTVEQHKRRKTEIFIGGLGRDAKEEDVRKVFAKAGEIVQIRMMMDGQTGKNKGYAFLRYKEPSQAKKAINEFAKVEICGKLCGAAALEGDDRIFLGNIDKKWKKEDLQKLLREIGVENIDTVTLPTDPNNEDSNRGFAFLEFETNRDAQLAYKKLQKKDAFGKGLNIKVAWAEPLNDPDEEEMKKVKSVFVEGIPSSWNQEKVIECFKKFGKIERVVLSRDMQSAKRKDFAFVNFTTREDALSCIESFDKEELTENGSKLNIKVSLAKPVPKGKKNKGGLNKEKSKTVPNPAMPDYGHTVPGRKRGFTTLGDDSLYSNMRGYPRPRVDSSYLASNLSYGAPSRSIAGSSFPHYSPRYQNVNSTYYGATEQTNNFQMSHEANPYRGGPYNRY